MTDIQTLKALAESATPGPWECREADGSAAICHAHGWVADDFGEQTLIDTRYMAAANPAEVLELIAENERLQRFETAYKAFSDKTDWVRPNAAAHELGMHVADVIRKRCDDLTSHNQAQADEIVRLRKDRDRLAADYAALAEDPGSAL